MIVEKQDFLNEWHQERLINWLPYFDGIVKELVRSFKPSLVLDIGCSDCLLLNSFWKLGVKGCGVDISKEPVSYVPDKVKSNIILLDIEKENLPFRDNTFDLITILEVLEHLHDHSLIISEMYRVLKHNGLVLMSSPIESKVLKIANKLLGKLSKIKEESNNLYDYEICGYAPHINVHPRKFWIREFESEGFKIYENFKRTHKELIKGIIAIHQPKENVAKFLVKFGRIGRKIRFELAYLLWGTTLLFEKV